MTVLKNHANDRPLTVTIPASQSVSDAIALEGPAPRGISVLIPSTWDAANLGIQVSLDGAVFVPLAKENGELVRITGIKTSEARGYVFPAGAWAAGGYKSMRLVSLNTSALADAHTPVNQTGARSIGVAFLA